MSEFLSPTELHDLTGMARVKAQAEWLTAHFIPHKLDGKHVIVSREHVRAWLAGRVFTPSVEPVFDRPF